MKKTTKFLLTAGATVATLIAASSCGNRAEKEVVAERTPKEAQKWEMDSVYRHARDSVLDVLNYDETVYPRLFDAEQELERIDGLSEKSKLRENVDALIAKRSLVRATEIKNLLAASGVRIDETKLAEIIKQAYFEYAEMRTRVSDIDVLGIYDHLSPAEKAEEKARWLRPPMSELFGTRGIVDWRKYNLSTESQKSIERAALKIWSGANNEIYNAIAAEVKKFAVYYPELDIEKSGLPDRYLEYASMLPDPISYENGVGFGFESAESVLILERSASVYGGNLDASFFCKQGAKYKLVKVSEGKWQVIRTDKNGRVAKTPVFEDNYTGYGYSLFSVPKEEKHDNMFSFAPDDDKGVYISVREILWHKKGKNDRYPDANGKIVAKRDSVMKELAYLRPLDERMLQIRRQADSVAKIKQQQYMARRFNKR